MQTHGSMCKQCPHHLVGHLFPEASNEQKSKMMQHLLGLAQPPSMETCPESILKAMSALDPGDVENYLAHKDTKRSAKEELQAQSERSQTASIDLCDSL